MRHELKRHLEHQYMFEFGEEITENTNLFLAGIIDSHGYVELLGHLQNRYGIMIDEDVLAGDIMTSFARILGYVESRQRPNE